MIQDIGFSREIYHRLGNECFIEAIKLNKLDVANMQLLGECYGGDPIRKPMEFKTHALVLELLHLKKENIA